MLRFDFDRFFFGTAMTAIAKFLHNLISLCDRLIKCLASSNYLGNCAFLTRLINLNQVDDSVAPTV